MQRGKQLTLIFIFWAFLYFVLNYLSNDFLYYNFSLSIDSVFPLIPIFSIVYLSAYVLMFIPILDLKNLKAFGYSLAFLGLVTGFMFLFFPGTISRPILGNDFFSLVLSWIYSLDAPHNLFPSTHISFTFLVSLILNKKWIYVWFILICFSTLFTKQHYFLDVIGGLIVGTIAYEVYKIFDKN